MIRRCRSRRSIGRNWERDIEANRNDEAKAEVRVPMVPRHVPAPGDEHNTVRQQVIGRKRQRDIEAVGDDEGEAEARTASYQYALDQRL